MSGGADASGPVDAQPDVALLCDDGLSGVHAHPYPDDCLARPRACGDLSLSGQCRGDGILRARKDDEEGVSLRVHLAAAVLLKERAEEAVMLGQEDGVVLAEAFQQPGRPFDVGEEEGDGAAGKIGRHRFLQYLDRAANRCRPGARGLAPGRHSVVLRGELVRAPVLEARAQPRMRHLVEAGAVGIDRVEV